MKGCMEAGLRRHSQGHCTERAHDRGTHQRLARISHRPLKKNGKEINLISFRGRCPLKAHFKLHSDHFQMSVWSAPKCLSASHSVPSSGERACFRDPGNREWYCRLQVMQISLRAEVGMGAAVRALQQRLRRAKHGGMEEHVQREHRVKNVKSGQWLDTRCRQDVCENQTSMATPSN